MCRNIKTLYNFEPPATADEVQAATIQYVRKISGFSKPSVVNGPAFEKAIKEISVSSQKLLDSLKTNAPPKNREIEAEKARKRNRRRFAKT
ncbi:MAG: DUF2277 domain-containing protein [Pyrinomonadaceae bacterium]|nr:DUF2277 domain-containing protein [Pyrinomonadaceae bacterium]